MTEIRACLFVLNVLSLVSFCVLIMYAQNLNDLSSVDIIVQRDVNSKPKQTYPRQIKPEVKLKYTKSVPEERNESKTEYRDSKTSFNLSQNESKNVNDSEQPKLTFVDVEKGLKRIKQRKIIKREKDQKYMYLTKQPIERKRTQQTEVKLLKEDGEPRIGLKSKGPEVDMRHGNFDPADDEKFTKNHIENGFQKVDLITYVYSAIFDDVDRPVIRVIAVVKDLQAVDHNQTFNCIYTGNSSRIVTGYLYIIPEPKWGYRYRSAFILCKVLKNETPVEVSIGGNTKNRVSLRVIYPLKKRWRVTRCFSVFHSNFHNTIQVLQTIEISLVFGVEHFVIYINNVHRSLLKVLEKYNEMGVLTILRWNLPLNKSDIHYHGQLAALQDCLYRHLHVSDYILTGDSDELIVPRMFNSTFRMIETSLKHRPSCSSLVVRHTFFPSNLPSHSRNFPFKIEAQRMNLTFLLQTIHLKVLDPYERSKLIVKPTGVEIVGIHAVIKFRSGWGACVCPSNQCLLHHYRTVASEDFGLIRTSDVYLHRYSDIIVKRIHHRLKQWSITLTLPKT